MTKLILPTLFLAGLVAAASFPRTPQTPQTRASASAPDPGSTAALVARGEYLVQTMACADCHTPWHLGPNGPEPDVSRHLSGHPADLVMTAAPALPEGPWMTVASASMTAWSGPWGVSYTANLTPDVETGLGAWSEETFVAALRTGRHMGMGRPILPPMPWPGYAKMTDEDLHALFTYLRSIPAISNKVPEPLPPNN